MFARGAAGVRYRPTVAVIDLEAVRHNVRLLKPDEVGFMAVVKADGYGHGDVEVARAALQAGATWLGVALVEEGVGLREADIEAPILVLTQFPPGSEADALEARLTPTLYTDVGLRRLAAAAASRPDRGPLGVHVKVDTGMHRVGLPPERATGFVRDVADAGFVVEGLWTHFAKSEDLADPFTEEQTRRFRQVVADVRAEGVRPRALHAANSAAAMALPATWFDLLRVGVAMYGLPPGPGLPKASELRPAMSWKSAVALAKRVGAGEGLSYGLTHRLDREATVATVPVGYADGYGRLMGNRSEVLIRGRRYRVAGTVTMDQLLVECGDDPIAEGDEVVLIGRQGSEEVTAGELAGLLGTIAYEVVCGVSERVPREFVGGKAE